MAVCIGCGLVFMFADETRRTKALVVAAVIAVVLAPGFGLPRVLAVVAQVALGIGLLLYFRVR